VTTTTGWERGLGNDWLVLGPDLSLDVEGVDVAERDTGVVKTTVTSVDVELSVVQGATSVSAWAWSADGGLFIVMACFVTEAAAPGQV